MHQTSKKAKQNEQNEQNEKIQISEEILLW
jgi:hypothetical protein